MYEHFDGTLETVRNREVSVPRGSIVVLYIKCRVPTGGVRCDQPHAPYSIKVRLLQYQ